MLNIILSLFFILSTVPAFAILTPNVIPETQSSGHGVSPTSKDSDITDVKGVSVSIGVPTSVQGSLVCTAANGVCPSGGGAGTVTSVTASSPLSSSGGTTPNITVSSSTGSGSIVLSTSPTLVTPALGTPSSGVATNLTGTASALNIGGNAATATNISTNGTGTQVWGMNSGSQAWINQSGGGGGVGVGTVNNGTQNYVSVYQSQQNTIGPSSELYDNGNIGIGTIHPGQLLDVQGTLRGLNFSGPGTSLTGTATSLNIGGNAATVTTNANLTGVITSSGNATSTGAQTGTGNTFVMQAGNPEFTGNVGVGSVTPGQTVDVQGTVRAIAFLGSGAALTGISGSISGQTTNYLPVASNSTTFIPSVVNQVSGNVGINTASPGQTVDIQGTVRVSQLVQIGAGGATITGLNGNVGIGSTAPGQTLDVNGTVRMIGFNLTGNGASSGNVMVTNGVGIGTWMSPSSIGATGGSGSNYWLLATGGNVGINTSYNVGINTLTAGNALTVVGNGQFIGTGTTNFTTNVGIGSTVPGQALDVQGTVRALSFIGDSFQFISETSPSSATNSGDISITNTNYYLVTFSFTTTSGSDFFVLRINNDTGSDYAYIYNGFGFSAIAQNDNSTSSTSIATSATQAQPGANIQGYFYIFPQSSNGTKSLRLKGNMWGNSTAMCDFAGTWNNSATATSFRILTSGGATFSGDINLYRILQS